MRHVRNTLMNALTNYYFFSQLIPLHLLLFYSNYPDPSFLCVVTHFAARNAKCFPAAPLFLLHGCTVFRISTAISKHCLPINRRTHIHLLMFVFEIYPGTAKNTYWQKIKRGGDSFTYLSCVSTTREIPFR